jgi:hypothetical protein
VQRQHSGCVEAARRPPANGRAQPDPAQDPPAQAAAEETITSPRRALVVRGTFAAPDIRAYSPRRIFARIRRAGYSCVFTAPDIRAYSPRWIFVRVRRAGYSRAISRGDIRVQLIASDIRVQLVAAIFACN